MSTPHRLVSRGAAEADDRAFSTFCAKRNWTPSVVEWAKGQYTTYSDYKARFRSELTFEDWLRVNSKPAR